MMSLDSEHVPYGVAGWQLIAPVSYDTKVT